MQVKGLRESDLQKLRLDVAETAKQMSLAAQQLQQMESICGERLITLLALQKQVRWCQLVVKGSLEDSCSI
jgi:hypothetical protein